MNTWLIVAAALFIIGLAILAVQYLLGRRSYQSTSQRARGMLRILAGGALIVLGLIVAGAAVAQPKAPDIDAGAVFVVAQAPLYGGPYRRAVAIAAPIPGGGHFGVVLNRPMKLSLAKIFPDHAPAKAVRGPVHFGGLYQSRAVMAMARSSVAPAPAPKALQIMPGVWLALDADPVDRIILESPNAARFYLGMILWEAGLLREQIDSGALAVLPADPAALFLEDTSTLYDELSRKLIQAGRIKRVRY